MKVTTKVTLDFDVTLHLKEQEVAALDALVGYGFKPFLETFYEKMGRAYLEPHERGLKTLFEKIDEIRPSLSLMKEVRAKGNEIAKKYYSND